MSQAKVCSLMFYTNLCLFSFLSKANTDHRPIFSRKTQKRHHQERIGSISLFFSFLRRSPAALEPGGARANADVEFRGAPGPGTEPETDASARISASSKVQQFAQPSSTSSICSSSSHRNSMITYFCFSDSGKINLIEACHLVPLTLLFFSGWITCMVFDTRSCSEGEPW